MAAGLQMTDAELIAQTLAGNRDAFGEIVARYQTLICSLAYSACGDIHLSEELAQETFLAAWRRLRDLREPAKLRPWLCGIARNLSHNALRRQQRVPTASAEELDEKSQSPTASPSEQTISREEETMLWKVLEELPATYREPMILFYREEESVRVVAEALELSEDAVKQRLSRGRVMVSEHIERTLRAALRNSAPGKAFILGVLMALPTLTISAKAAAVGATAVKGTAGAKAATATGLLGMILSPVLILLGYYTGYRLGIDDAQTSRERKFIKSFYVKLTALMAGFCVSFGLLLWWASSGAKNHPALFSGLLIGLGCVYTLAAFALALWSWRKKHGALARFSAKENALSPGRADWEYRSQFTVLGLPLVHVRLSPKLSAEPPVKAWIAVGDYAVGGLIAFGAIAIAPVSFGLGAIGLLSWGLMAIGLFAVGGLSIGLWSLGGLALGWQAWGGCAIAWNVAVGAAAVAHDFALGGIAQAAQANNKIAQKAAELSLSFRSLAAVYHHFLLFNLIWVVPLFFWWRVAAKSAKSRRPTK